MAESVSAMTQNFAPNCGYFAACRTIPIPGIAKPPKPWRSSEHPEGIPGVGRTLTPDDRERLHRDTELAHLSAKRCIAAVHRGRDILFEHPLNSIAWHLSSWQELVDMPTTTIVPHSHCMFEGGAFDKTTEGSH